MRIYKSGKTVLRVYPDGERFFGGLTSNEIDQPQNAFLNLHGRIVATFDQRPESPDAVLIAVEAAFVPPLLKHIEKYLALSKVQVVPAELKAFYDLDNRYPSGGPGQCIPQKRGKLVLAGEDGLQGNIPEEEFRLFRVENNIPVQGVDYNDEFVLNVSEDFVSFTKGCFLGQEPVSKVHNRSRPTWKLTVKYEDECSEDQRAKLTSRVIDPRTQRAKGFVFVKNE